MGISDYLNNHPLIYEDITYNNEVRYFFKTFLTERKSILEREIDDRKISDEYFELYPTIEIEEIILGNNLDDNRKVEIVQLLRSLQKKYNYSFKFFRLTNENEIIESDEI
jgi:hypothetical protein